VDFDECPCTGKTLARLLQPAIMSVLAQEPLHGYLIAQRLRTLAIFEGTTPDYAGVYRTLNAMQEQGLVRASWDTPESGPAKRCYQLTRAGKACMAQWLETLQRYERAIHELTEVLGARLA